MRSKRWIISAAILAVSVLILVNIGFTGNEKQPTESKLNWLKYDEGLQLAAKLNKPVFVDFYTNWCKFCKKMDRETFADESIYKYMNEKFVMVKVNAESNNVVATADGNISEKDLSRSFGVRGYPTYWFLKSSGEKINNISGYAPPERFITVLKYIGDNIYQDKTWNEYLKGLQAN